MGDITINHNGDGLFMKFCNVMHIMISYFQYFIVVLLLFIILLIGGILGYVFKDKAGTSIKNTMISTMRDYGTNNFEQVTKAWDETQQAVSTWDLLLSTGDGCATGESLAHQWEVLLLLYYFVFLSFSFQQFSVLLFKAVKILFLLLIYS